MRIRIWLLLLLVTLGSEAAFGKLQGQARIDSLLKELRLQKEDTNKAKMLHEVSSMYSRSNADEGLKFARDEYALCSKLGWVRGIGKSNHVLGVNYSMKSDYPNALAYYFKALSIFEKIADKYEITTTTMAIGELYYRENDFPKALENYFKALDMADSYGYADLQSSIADNIGAVYGNQGDNESALKYFLRSLEYSEKSGYKKGIASTTHNIGNIYVQQKNYVEGLQYYFRALKINEETGNKLYKAINFGEIGNTYLELASERAKANGTDTRPELRSAAYEADGLIPKGRKQLLQKAVEYLEKAIQTDMETGNVNHMGHCYSYLYIADTLLGNFSGALRSYQKFVAIKDSIYDEDKKVEMMRLGMLRKMDVDSLKAAQAKKVVELKYRQQRTFTYGGLLGIFLLAGFSVFIIRERKKSERLLLNILPGEVAKELKTTGSTTAKHYDNVTVLFTDFVNFTQAAEQMDAQGLIDELHICFKMFDEITDKYNIEKIKTIGDAYLAVAGLPTADPRHAENIVKAAKEITMFMEDRLGKMGAERTFQVRVGVHSGSVVAGIVGVKKFAYDIWGDTVNTAARMEQNCEAGKINISETTYELVKNKFSCEYRGEVEAKGKGVMKMYFVG
ncbi:MAG: tetratricopeptide repeat protein [Taibaiella sp.]|nr:tetratricopeptide repeat protein [Taibaiella sp.]